MGSFIGELVGENQVQDTEVFVRTVTNTKLGSLQGRVSDGS